MYPGAGSCKREELSGGGVEDGGVTGLTDTRFSGVPSSPGSKGPRPTTLCPFGAVGSWAGGGGVLNEP